MKQIIKIVLYFILVTAFINCGGSGGSDKTVAGVILDGDGEVVDQPTIEVSNIEVLDMPKTTPCKDGEYLRLKTDECLPLKNPTWGFIGFTVPDENVYNLTECTQKALVALMDALPIGGGKIVMPECKIEIKNGIDLPSNIILEGAGIGKTIISNTLVDNNLSSAIRINESNIVLRNFTIDGNSVSLNGIDAYSMPTGANILVEFIEAKNFKSDQGSGISFLTKVDRHYSRITVRYCISHNSLHGINVGIGTYAKMLIYSNQAYNNRNYGLDMSGTYGIEVAGNYLHNNDVTGAKSPNGNLITYHHNDINFNKIGGISYMGGGWYYSITLEENDLSDNGGLAFNASSASFRKLILKNNIVTESIDENGYSIGASGVKFVDVYGDHGRIWSETDSNITYY